jgi:hypothetical protein
MFFGAGVLLLSGGLVDLPGAFAVPVEYRQFGERPALERTAPRVRERTGSVFVRELAGVGHHPGGG